MKLIARQCEKTILKYLKNFPVTAILGPRQAGKSTLAREIIKNIPDSIYLDLELTTDRNKLSDPEAFFKFNNSKLICLDEIQRLPEIFSLLRSICDITNRPSQFLILGSASPDLLKQSSESLAGRIVYHDLTPFNINEVAYKNMRQHWLKGGFPRSYLTKDINISYVWRDNFIRTYLENDITKFGFSISSQTIHKLWMMLAHSSGSILNKSKLAAALGISHTTVAAYIDILEKTYMVRILPSYFINTKKRLIKNPKVYIRDTGILHSLLSIKEQNDLFGHPIYGNSWETYAVEQICSSAREWTPGFYQTSNGTEIDLILEKGVSRIAIEFKVSSSPNIPIGLKHLMDDLNLNKLYIVAPLEQDEEYPVSKNVIVTSISNIIKLLN